MSKPPLFFFEKIMILFIALSIASIVAFTIFTLAFRSDLIDYSKEIYPDTKTELVIDTPELSDGSAIVSSGDEIFLVTKILIKEEGFRKYPYRDSEGHMTIGYGTRIEGFPERNFMKNPLTKEEALAKLESDVDTLVQFYLKGKYGDNYQDLSPKRKSILLSMGYQLGTLGVMKFKNMWKAINNGDFRKAGIEMKDSKWYRQTPSRASSHIKVMMKG